MVLLSWFIRRCNVSALMGRSGKPVGVICPGRSITASSSDSSLDRSNLSCRILLKLSIMSASVVLLSCATVAGKGCVVLVVGGGVRSLLVCVV